jgi:polysaccharide biosynthesis protein PslH
VRILVVCTRSPYPLIEGRALRTYNLLREAARTHSVYLCTYVQSEAEEAGIDHLRSFCQEVRSVPLYMSNKAGALATDVISDLFAQAPVMVLKYRTREMRRAIADAVAQFKPDLVHLDMLHLGELMHDLPGLPIVMVEHNVEAALLRRRVANESHFLRRTYLARQADKLERYEAHVCRTASEIVAVSEVDAENIRAFAPKTPVTVVPNGVDTEFFAPRNDTVDPAAMVYVGGLSWFPNYDAIDFFTKEVLQRIAAAQQNARLTVIGQVPSEKMLEPWRNEPRVKFTGLVDDIRPTVAAAGVYIVPLRIGGGTRLKILDAMAMGKAVVTTSVGCEGLEVVPGRDVLVADGAEAFANAVIRVMSDRALAAQLAAAGRACVERNYRWSAIAQRMESVYARAVNS